MKTANAALKAKSRTAGIVDKPPKLNATWDCEGSIITDLVDQQSAVWPYFGFMWLTS